MFRYMLYLIWPPQAKTIMQKEITDAERSLHAHESAALYHQKMAEYYKANLNRMHNQLGRGEPHHG